MERLLFFVISFIFIALLDVINCFIHGTGAFLLYCFYRKNRECTQNLFILNLACAELAYSFFDIINSVTHFYEFLTKDYKNFEFCASITFTQCGTSLLYYAAMFLLTGDRLFQTAFPFKYRRFWDIERTKKIIILVWVLTSLFVVILIILSTQYGYINYFYKFYPYYLVAILSLDSLFFAFAILTYISMFYSYIKSRKSVVNITGNESIFKTFINSRFYVSGLIIGSFLMLGVLAHFLYISNYIHRDGVVTLQSLLYADVSFRFSFTVDGIIYIYLQKSSRKTFLEKLRFKRRKPYTSNTIEDMRQLRQRVSHIEMDVRMPSTRDL